MIQDLLVRRQFSLVPDNRTNVYVEACRYAQNRKIGKKNNLKVLGAKKPKDLNGIATIG
jgi:hypothetical protein